MLSGNRFRPRTVFRFLALSVVLWSGLVGVASANPVPAPLYETIRTGDYDRAMGQLGKVETGPESMFLSGVIAFERENYTTARTRFRRVVDRTDTTHVRHRDSLYYLDRLKLYHEPSREPPRIRVKIDETSTAFTFDSDIPVDVLVDGELRTRVNTSKIRIETRFDSVVVVPLGGTTTRASRITLRPTSGEAFPYDGVDYRGTMVLRASKNGIDLINELPLTDYLYGVVRKELAPGWPMAVLKAQAVASRSFALHRMINKHGEPFHVSATSKSQVYGGRTAETPRIKRAVDRTRGEVLAYRGRVVPAYFHANSGGYIEKPESVWGGDQTGFIRSKRDQWSLESNHAQWTESLTTDQINHGLRSAGHPALNSGRASIHVKSKLPSERASTIQYASRDGTVSLSANDFRVAVGAGKMKSTWITSVREDGDQITFSGRGWGHGVGMSQWGARAMAESGKSYGEILQFYFEPTRIAGQYGPAQVVSTVP